MGGKTDKEFGGIWLAKSYSLGSCTFLADIAVEMTAVDVRPEIAVEIRINVGAEFLPIGVVRDSWEPVPVRRLQGK